MDFAEVISLNWTPADHNVLKYFRETAASYLEPGNGISLALYYQDDKPVAVIELFPSDKGTLGIYGLATLASYRGKGIGSAMMDFALNRVKADQYKVAVLQASEDGINIYEQYGFRTVTDYFEYA